MKVISAVDPFTYAVHGFKELLLKNTGLAAIGFDLVYLAVFTVLAMTAATRSSGGRSERRKDENRASSGIG